MHLGTPGTNGASPRGRRNPERAPRDELLDGCISAWAEEPACGARRCSATGVHLRVGGGTSRTRTKKTTGSGASPRGRRNPDGDIILVDLKRCISAWAEEPLRRRMSTRLVRVHLRVGGGTHLRPRGANACSGASPRGRRNPLDHAVPELRRGCISAWAEEPGAGQRLVDRDRVHLRVGGGTYSERTHAGHDGGASPRGRRNRLRAREGFAQAGCISAWAEEP